MKKGQIRILLPFFGLVLCGLMLLAERSGIGSSDIQVYNNVSDENISYTADVSINTECLLIKNSKVELSRIYYESMAYVLDSMSVGYDSLDLNTDKLPVLDKYETIVLAITDLSYLREDIVTLESWVKEGGRLMNAYPYTPGSSFNILATKMGIEEVGDYTVVEKIKVEEGFMVGGGRTFDFGEKTGSSLEVFLDNSCQVHIRGIDRELPILWGKEYGKGKFIVVNKEESGKSNRGFLAAAYSLLQPAFIYPVINASAFYIDDFPAPIPDGENAYITRDYHMNINDFYMNIWWPTLLQWEETYGIIHTGMIIEQYSDLVRGPFIRQESTKKYKFYGNMLLNNNGELGLHGYNHMPLCTTGFDYRELYDGYKLWPSVEMMEASLEELLSFSKSLFPEQSFSVYVPPSNILSEEGRQVILNKMNNIKTISSSYLPADGGVEYIQEFEIAQDGLIEAPRIISGCNMDDFMELAAFSELNFHYVQSHFLHPDDSLDEDRGAAIGWEKLSESFETYLNWVYNSAPTIRNVTGSQMGQAVEQYDKLTVQKTYKDKELKLSLGGFSKEAYLMFRINEGDIDSIQGGEYENITGSLYLIHALQDQISITWK